MSKQRYIATAEDVAEQWDFLRSSMGAFDEGRVHEAKRIAVAVRVLVYDHGGTSVLTQLGVKEEISWFSSGRVNPANELPTQGLSSMRMAATAEGMETTYVAKGRSDVLQLPHSWVEFSAWWNDPVIKTRSGLLFSRRNLILMLANRAGGAHVGKLDGDEQALAAGKDFGWEMVVGDTSTPIELNVVPASVRTIATEVDITFERHAKLLGL